MAVQKAMACFFTADIATAQSESADFFHMVNLDCLHLAPPNARKIMSMLQTEINQIWIKLSVSLEAGQYLEETNAMSFLLEFQPATLVEDLVVLAKLPVTTDALDPFLLGG